MRQTLKVLNELVEAGVIESYAVGGAMAAVFYTEPVLTFDLDVFVLFAVEGANLRLIEPLYAELRARGYVEDAECVTIEGVPVQFLPAYNPLIEEALREAREIEYEGIPVRVARVEHLIAICIQTGRDKDRERVRLLREVPALDRRYLDDVLERHRLESAWLP